MIELVVVNYRTPQHLLRCLASVPAERHPDVLVVDNASGDDSVALVRAAHPAVRVLEMPDNDGFGAGAHAGLLHTTAPHVLVLNADTELVGDALDVLDRYLVEHTDCAVVGPVILGLDGRHQASAFPWPSPADFLLSELRVYSTLRGRGATSQRQLRLWDHGQEREVPWVIGCAFAVRRSAYDAVGGFDRGFPMYFEEVDLCYRLTQAGWSVDLTPAASVVHVGGASTDAVRTAMRIQFHRSMARWYRLHRGRGAQQRLRAAVLVVATSLGLLNGLRVLATTQDRRTRAGEDLRAWLVVARETARGWST